MRQSRDTLCLALKTRAAIGITGNVIGKDFNRDRAIETGVPGFVDLPHAPGINKAEDLVRAEPRASGKGHGRASRRGVYADQPSTRPGYVPILPRSRHLPRASTDGATGSPRITLGLSRYGLANYNDRLESQRSAPWSFSGARLGPYEIVSALGAGGMGEVYRARDTRLDRIAIKVILGRETASSAMRERFEREARAIALLSHANICTLHDIGHHEGTDFLVMEYLEGETLAARLSRQKVRSSRGPSRARHPRRRILDRP